MFFFKFLDILVELIRRYMVLLSDSDIFEIFNIFYFRFIIMGYFILRYKFFYGICLFLIIYMIYDEN